MICYFSFNLFASFEDALSFSIYIYIHIYVYICKTGSEMFSQLMQGCPFPTGKNEEFL